MYQPIFDLDSSRIQVFSDTAKLTGPVHSSEWGVELDCTGVFVGGYFTRAFVLCVHNRLHATSFFRTACTTLITITYSLHVVFCLMISVWQCSLCPKCSEFKKRSLAYNYRHLLHSSQTDERLWLLTVSILLIIYFTFQVQAYSLFLASVHLL